MSVREHGLAMGSGRRVEGNVEDSNRNRAFFERLILAARRCASGTPRRGCDKRQLVEVFRVSRISMRQTYSVRSISEALMSCDLTCVRAIERIVAPRAQASNPRCRHRRGTATTRFSSQPSAPSAAKASSARESPLQNLQLVDRSDPAEDENPSRPLRWRLRWSRADGSTVAIRRPAMIVGAAVQLNHAQDLAWRHSIATAESRTTASTPRSRSPYSQDRQQRINHQRHHRGVRPDPPMKESDRNRTAQARIVCPICDTQRQRRARGLKQADAGGTRSPMRIRMALTHK